MEKIKLLDRKVLMTGASSGVGWAIAQTLIDAGADVAVISRRNPLDWERGPFKDWDEDNRFIQADVRDAANLIEKIQKWLELNDYFINVLIQSAISYGVGSRHSLLDTNIDEWDNIFATNVRSEFLILKTILPSLMQQAGALIVGISSDVVFKPGPGRIAYAASKSASHSLYTGLAEELEDTSINVIELYPERGIATPGIEKRRPPGFKFSPDRYDSADLFSKPLLPIIQSLGQGLNGELLVVKDGRLVATDMRKLS